MLEEPGRALVEFVRENFPRRGDFLAYGVPALLLAYGYLGVAAVLRSRCDVPTAYTRKVFHFLIFFTAALLDVFAGTRVLCLFGGMVSVGVLHALLCGEGHPFYEALAREKDAPRRSYYVVAPYLATLFGGVVSHVFFGAAALYGFLVTGLADALAEPVGARWGKRWYRVTAVRGVSATRSYEGSLAVFLASALALSLGVLLSGGDVLVPRLVASLHGIAVACTVVEAFSPHGWDNATLQVTATALAANTF